MLTEIVDLASDSGAAAERVASVGCHIAASIAADVALVGSGGAPPRQTFWKCPFCCIMIRASGTRMPAVTIKEALLSLTPRPSCKSRWASSGVRWQIGRRYSNIDWRMEVHRIRPSAMSSRLQRPGLIKYCPGVQCLVSRSFWRMRPEVRPEINTSLNALLTMLHSSHTLVVTVLTECFESVDILD